MNRIFQSGRGISKGLIASRSTPLILRETSPIFSRHNLDSIFTHMASGRLMRYVTIAGSAALISGTYYGYMSYRKFQPSMAAIQRLDSMQLSTMPKIEPTCQIEGPTKLPFDVTLFQYCSCPFCCKARTFLDYFGVSYNIVEVDPVFRKKLEWSAGYKKVPVLLAHTKAVGDGASGETKVYQINDSSVIMSCLGSLLLSTRRALGDSSPKSKGNTDKTIDDLAKILVNYQTIEVDDEETGKKLKDIPNKYFLMLGDIKDVELKKREVNLAEERQWREWTDRVLVHSLSPNIYRTIPEALQAFRNFSVMGQWDKHFTAVERGAAIYMGSAVMWLVGKRLKKKYNLKDDVRESLYDNCRLWMKAIGTERRFMGGDRPNLADLSVFGVLRSIEGCTAFQDLLDNTKIGTWYSAVKDSCQSHAGRQLLESI